jgi:hypothetical protein
MGGEPAPAVQQGYGAAVVEGGVDLLEAVTASSDGERDPRCLMLMFSAVRELLSLYAGLGLAASEKLKQVRAQ